MTKSTSMEAEAKVFRRTSSRWKRVVWVRYLSLLLASRRNFPASVCGLSQGHLPGKGTSPRPGHGNTSIKVEKSGESQLRSPQPQRVADDRDRAEAHGRRRNHRRKEQPEERVESPRRDRHAEGVIDEREEEVLLDVRHRAAREAPRAHDA